MAVRFGSVVVGSSRSIASSDPAARNRTGRRRGAADYNPAGRPAIAFHEALLEKLDRVGDRLLSGEFLFMVGVVLALQWRFPARPAERGLTKGACQDVLWFVVAISFWAVVLAFYLDGLAWLFDNHLAFLRFDLGAVWPMPVLIAVAFVVGDFLSWFHHWMRHKVPLFWRFHQVHHSQTEMNMFADSRVHFIEPFITKAVTFGPFFVLGGDFSRTVFVFAVLQPWYARFYHANIRTNLGPLKHVLVTPQYHRVHHSRLPQHQDKNFGDILTIWDRLFGTMHPDFDEYPDTGVEDVAFPLEQSRNPFHLVMNYLRQLVYPFRRRGRVGGLPRRS